jgi:hypothetical protein
LLIKSFLHLVKIDSSEPYEIIGVVKDEKYRSFTADSEAIAYVPYRQGFWGITQLHPFSLVIHTEKDPLAMVDRIRGEVRLVDKEIPLSKNKD